MTTQQAESAFQGVKIDSKLGQQAHAIFREVYEEANLGTFRAELLNQNPKFREGLANLLKTTLVHGEEVRRLENWERYTYGKGYAPKPLEEQVNRLRELFPGLSESLLRKPKTRLTRGAEAWFAIPQYGLIHPSYSGAVQRVREMLGARGVPHLLEDDSTAIQQSKRTSAALDSIAAKQQAGVCAVPAQLGLRHRARSARLALELCEPNEFGLGAYEVGIILLTHPERLRCMKDLAILCAGDERPARREELGLLRSTYFVNPELTLGAWQENEAFHWYASATGFVPD